MVNSKDPQIRPASDFANAVVDRFHPKSQVRPGFPYDWEHTREKDLRCLPGEMSVWTGINGHGKSLLLGQVALMAKAAGELALIASFEMKAEKTLYRMVRQATCLKHPSEGEIKKTLRWMGQGISIYDFVGRADTKTMIRLFIESAQIGYTQFLVDSLMKCGIDEDDYNSQKRMAEDLQNFAQDYDVHVHLVAHPRKGQDELSMVGKMDVMGAGGITNVADNVYSVWRNKKKEEAVNKSYLEGSSLPAKFNDDCDAILWCCKHREDGSDVERKYPLWYERSSMQYISGYYAVPKIWCNLDID